MVYGYVNSCRGESEGFLKYMKYDKIIYHSLGDRKADLSFLKNGDTLIIYELKSICNNIKELLEFSQFIFQNQIEIYCADNDSSTDNAFIDTKTAIGKMIINVLSALNDFDNRYFQNI